MYSSKFIFSDDFKSLGLKVGLLDAGARSDLPDPWCYLAAELLDIIGFEPDPVECDRLTKLYPSRKYFPFALWNTAEKVGIRINKTPSTSSLFPTNDAIATYFDSVHFNGRKTEKVIEVEGVKLDDVVNPLVQFDFFKIDTQGAEKMILEGAKNLIEKTKPIIIAEAWNVDAYQGAPTAGEIILFMEKCGYFVLDMEVTASWLYKNSSKSWLGSRARATGVDLVFIPKFENMKKLSPEALLKRAAVLELFGYRDLAVSIMENLYQGDQSIKKRVIGCMMSNASIEAGLLKKIGRRVSLLMGKKSSPHAPIHD